MAPTRQPLTLLVNPDWRQFDQPGRFRTEVAYFPLELMYVEATLRARGRPALMADLWGGTLTAEEFAAGLAEARYVVLTTAPTYVFWRDGVCGVEFPIEQMRRIKLAAPEVKLIAIGPQGTIIPESLAEAPIDYLVRGEAEAVVADLIDRIEAGLDPSDLPGVCVRSGAQWRVSPRYATVERLDALPALSFESIARGHYGQVSFEASRGCPYDCLFCCRAGFRNKLRLKSIDRLREELTALKAGGYNYVAMIDEIFGVNRDWLRDFCAMIRPLNLRWAIQTRTECLDEERLKWLRESGCMSIEIGLESADPTVAQNVAKRVDLNRLAGNVRTAAALGFEQVRLFCILGLPGETRRSIRATERFMLPLAPLPAVQLDVYPMLPLPGTGVWQLGIRKGYPLRSWDDVETFAGVIENDFKDTRQVRAACARLERRWEYARLRGPLSGTFSGRLTLARMWLTIQLPFLMGLRRRLRALLGGQTTPGSERHS